MPVGEGAVDLDRGDDADREIAPAEGGPDERGDGAGGDLGYLDEQDLRNGVRRLATMLHQAAQDGGNTESVTPPAQGGDGPYRTCKDVADPFINKSVS